MSVDDGCCRAAGLKRGGCACGGRPQGSWRLAWCVSALSSCSEGGWHPILWARAEHHRWSQKPAWLWSCPSVSGLRGKPSRTSATTNDADLPVQARQSPSTCPCLCGQLPCTWALCMLAAQSWALQTPSHPRWVPMLQPFPVLSPAAHVKKVAEPDWCHNFQKPPSYCCLSGRMS